jgi:FAD/FMN-containing dehydrogenase
VRRRNLLKSAVLLGLAGTAAGLPRLALGRPPARRVRPSDAAWPSGDDWQELARELAGNLVRPSPLALDCAREADGDACRELLHHLQNPYYIGDQASGTQVSGWLDAWEPALSAYAVACRTSGDAAAAINFARRHNLRLVVKGGGHSYQGTSNAPDSLLIWTRPMQAITLHDHFVGEGCAGFERPAPAVTVEAGALWMDVYDAVTTRGGRYVQGGGCATVGVAGLVQSGGFGSFSKRYGTAASSLLEAEVVTADGRIRRANSRLHPDLFWALKGGGGGSWGVVTKLTLLTHELPEYFGAAFGTIQASSDASFRRLIGRFVEFFAESLCNPHWGESVSIREGNVFSISMTSQGLDSEAAGRLWKPFFDWIRASPQEFTFKDEPGTVSRGAREWWDVEARRRRGSTSVIFDDRPGEPVTHAWWSGDQEQVGAFLHGYDSAWLPATLLQEANRAGLADALSTGSRHAAIELHFNKGLAGAPAAIAAAALATATNPAVVDAFALAIVATGGAPRYAGLPGASGSDVDARENARKVDRAMAALFEISPSPGSYVSESNYFNPCWQDAYWGSNYARLQAIKRRFDPAGLFYVHNGVGSEDWSADGFSRLR